MAVWWQGGLVPIFVIALFVFGRRVLSDRHAEGTLLFAAVVLATLFSLNDYAAAVGWLPYTQVIALHLGLPLVFVAMGGVLATRFIRALNEAEDANEQLEIRVADREAELTEKYAQLRAMERREAANAERQRIMQDLHDGLGTQLVSSLMMIEKGGTPEHDVARMLREAIDDMRLAIDALSPGEGDLQGSIANLRHRMEPRFRAAGVALGWKIEESPDAPRVGPHLGLQILRVVQESLSNALRHGGATRIDVALAISQSGVSLEIRDNGRGFDEDAVRPRRGRQNMRQRARAVNATLQIDSGPGGSVIRLTCPFPPEAAVATSDEYRSHGIASPGTAS